MASAPLPERWFSTPRARAALLFYILFAIAFGFGYPTLNRYDPRTSRVPDSQHYYAMTLFDYEHTDPRYASRVLLPTLSAVVLKCVSVFNWQTWDKVFLSLLIVNALFMAGVGVLLVRLGLACGLDERTGVLAALLLLTAFLVPNLFMAGLVDAGECFFFCALLLALRHGRWAWLPALVLLGALAKNTFVLAALPCLGAWCWAENFRSLGRRELLCLAAAAVLGLAVPFIVSWAVSGQATHFVGMYRHPPLSPAFPGALAGSALSILKSTTFLLGFCVLLPLGLWRLGRLPRSLLWGSAATALVLFAVAAWTNIADNAARPLFSVLGPPLALSSAALLSGLCGARNNDEQK